MEEKVSFFSEGSNTVGTLFIPDNIKDNKKYGAIIYCSGFTGPRDTSMLYYSRYFTKNGYIGLSFDYRGFGESTGIRWRLLPRLQVEDIRNALTFLKQYPFVDEKRIGLFGCSYGGALALYAAAMDIRAKFVIAHVPVGNGRKWLKGLREEHDWGKFQKEVDEDQIRRVKTGSSKKVGWLHIMVPDEESRKFAEERRIKNPGACTELFLETAQAVMEFDPEEVVHKIAPRPILFTAVEKDKLVPIDQIRAIYKKAKKPKNFILIKNKSHFDTYYDPSCRKSLTNKMLLWLNKIYI